MAQIPWSKVKEYFYFDRVSGFGLDVSGMKFSDDFIEILQPKLASAYREMKELEAGGLINKDENRMVGHYWLRNPMICPQESVKKEIVTEIEKIKTFCSKIVRGEIRSSRGMSFKNFILVGIGGSALGPQFVNKALSPINKDVINTKLKAYYVDNTDPHGIESIVSEIRDLSQTLVIVISKSGGTKETRNGQLLLSECLRRASLNPSKHLVAVTCEGSALDTAAEKEGWLERFYFWDWVGGRTSQFSAVGLIPALLQGIDINKLLEGAKHMDALTREASIKRNPAMLLAAMWYHAGCGKGLKDMVILPYSDRLELLSKYLQQLVMESLGKELDRDQNLVHQGISVFGNKGSTDQHAFVQQLRDGINNFFVTFIHVFDHFSVVNVDTTDFPISDYRVEQDVTATDYLSGFLHGTRKALYEKGRENIVISIPKVDPFTIGALIALYERAVGFYANLVNVNAYHQPGVEAGKIAASSILDMQRKVLNLLQAKKTYLSLDEIAATLSLNENKAALFYTLRNLALNKRISMEAGEAVFEDKYRFE
jgi:glucose-6-phosphate isomerase